VSFNTMCNPLQDHVFLYDMYTKYSSVNWDLHGVHAGDVEPSLYHFVLDVGFISLDMRMLRITGTGLQKSYM
jgi:hypothetical protein